MSIIKTARQFKIPRSTLNSKLTGRIPVEYQGRGGYHSTLGKTTEDELVTWINNSNERGLYISKEDLFTSVVKIMIEKKSPTKKAFQNHKPSKKFFYAFRRRHPELKWKSEAYTQPEKLTEGAVKLWLKNVDSQLGENAKILGCPERVFSLELLVFGCPEKDVILRNPRKGDTERVTTIFAANANGILMSPQTLYMTDKMPANADKQVPPGWKIGKTESGNITPSAFYDYFTSTFVNFLTDNKIRRPVVVYIDGQKSNLTLHLQKFCDKQKILLIPLCPDASHILHPLNVTLFESVRHNGMMMKKDYEEGRSNFMTKYNLPNLINKFMTKNGMKEDIIDKFKTTGLCPLKSDSVSEMPEGFVHQASSTTRRRQMKSKAAQSMEVDNQELPKNSDFIPQTSEVYDHVRSLSSNSEVDYHELSNSSVDSEVPHNSQYSATNTLQSELSFLESHLSFFEKRLKPSVLWEFRKTKAKARRHLGTGTKGKKIKKFKRDRGDYTKEKVYQALEAIRNGLSCRKASSQFNIPRSTLRDKINGVRPVETEASSGFYSILGKEIEVNLANWITSSNERGLIINKDGLYTSVEKIVAEQNLPRKGLFRNDKPSDAWLYAFRRRHPEMIWMNEKFTKADKLTDAAVKYWLRDVDNQLGEHAKILACPERVFSVEVLSFGFPEKYEFNLSDPKKDDFDRVSTIFAANANGVFAPPQTLYKLEKLPVRAFKLAPLGWKIGMTESGNITSFAFYEYFTTVFVTFLIEKKIQRPVIVYIDGQKSNLTLHLKKFCDKQKILLVPLCPDASHILHPLNVTLFETVRKEWMSTKADMEDGKFTFLTKYNLPAMLNMFMTMDEQKEALIESFKTTGLRPLKSDCTSEVPQGFEDHKASSTTTMTEIQTKALEPIEVDYEELSKISDPVPESPEIDDNESSLNSDLISEDSVEDFQELNSHVDLEVPEVPHSSQNDNDSQIHESSAMKILKLELDALESYLSFFEKRLKPSLLSQFRKTKVTARSRWKGDVKCTELYNIWRGIVMDVEKAKNKIP
ncbi:hypothetical protein DMENIID0001_103690 [Sergentomyia squamirostris]